MYWAHPSKSRAVLFAAISAPLLNGTEDFRCHHLRGRRASFKTVLKTNYGALNSNLNG
jgi:hypothetical protein